MLDKLLVVIEPILVLGIIGSLIALVFFLINNLKKMKSDIEEIKKIAIRFKDYKPK